MDESLSLGVVVLNLIFEGRICNFTIICYNKAIKTYRSQKNLTHANLQDIVKEYKISGDMN